MIKKILQLSVVLLLAANPLYSQEADSGNKIVGIWTTGSQKARINVKMVGNTYQGWIVWLRTPKDEQGLDKVDKNNPDDKFKTQKLNGIRTLKDFTYKGKNTWSNGTIYDPENGKTYQCIITLADKNTLDVRGYIGIRLLGRTDVWKRYEEK